MEQYTEKNKFTLWQYPLLISHLEEMAQKGWLLCKAEGNELVYDQYAPQKVHFAVTFFPAYDFLDPVPPPALERLWQFCENSGWQHVTDNASMQIFYNTLEEPVPLHTDALVQLENFDAMMKVEKVKLWKSNVIADGIFLLFIAAVFSFAAMDGALRNMLVRASPIMLLLLVKNFYTFITDGAKWFNYRQWYKKAKKTALENNRFYPPKENISLKKTDTAVTVAIMTALVLFALREGTMGTILLWCAIIFGVLGFYIMTLRIMKKDGVPAKETRTTATILVIFLVIVLIIMAPFIIMLMAESGFADGFVTMHREYPI